MAKKTNPADQREGVQFQPIPVTSSSGQTGYYDQFSGAFTAGGAFPQGGFPSPAGGFPAYSGGGGGSYPSTYAIGSINKGYQMAAGAYGYTLSAGQAQALFNGNVSVSEFTNRLQAINRVNSNTAVFDQFENVLRINKIANKFDLKDRLAFVTGESSAEFYKIWDEAATRGAAVNAGFGIVGPKGGGDLALTRANIQQIQTAAGIEGPTSGKIDQQLAKNLGTLADLSTSIGPLSRYAGLNITKTNLIEMLFGGPTQEATKQQVNQLLANQKAGETGPAEPAFRPTGTGLTSIGLQGLAGQEQA